MSAPSAPGENGASDDKWLEQFFSPVSHYRQISAAPLLFGFTAAVAGLICPIFSSGSNMITKTMRYGSKKLQERSGKPCDGDSSWGDI